MKVSTINNQSFGKIRVDSEIKAKLEEHIAYGLANEDSKNFKEKVRLCNNVYNNNYDIFVNATGVEVIDKISNTAEKDFMVNDFSEDTPNILYHLLNAAMNYVDLKESKLFDK